MFIFIVNVAAGTLFAWSLAMEALKICLSPRPGSYLPHIRQTMPEFHILITHTRPTSSNKRHASARTHVTVNNFNLQKKLSLLSNESSFLCLLHCSLCICFSRTSYPVGGFEDSVIAVISSDLQVQTAAVHTRYVPIEKKTHV